MADTLGQTTHTLRDRIVRGLRSGTLEPGDRLPSARELAAEFGVDNRTISAVYRELATEGLVEIRERGGVYALKQDARDADAAAIPAKWFADTFVGALERGIPGPDVANSLRRALDTLRLHAVVISTTDDQVAGLARELREDYGFIVDGFSADAIADAGLQGAALSRADLFVTTQASVGICNEVAAKFGKPYISLDVRPDLVVGEWAMLLRHPVWAVVATREFGDMLRHFFSGVRGIENLHVLVNGEDDLSAIPTGAPTYVTHRVRESIGVARIRGRILPPARTIALESARALFEFIVRANLRAARAIEADGRDQPNLALSKGASH